MSKVVKCGQSDGCFVIQLLSAIRYHAPYFKCCLDEVGALRKQAVSTDSRGSLQSHLL